MTPRDVAGILASDAVFLVVGYALLFGLGLVRSWVRALRFVGLALFAGWAVVGVLASLLLVAGGSLALWEVLALAAAATLAGAAPARRVPAARPVPVLRERGLPLAAAVVGAAVVVVYLLDLLRQTTKEVTTAWDANSFWLPKAAAIVVQNGIHTGPATIEGMFNPDYPIFAPAQEAISWRFTGNLHVEALPTQHWIVAVAFLAAAAALLADRVRPAILWPGLALVVLMPAFEGLIGSSLGDEPLAMLLGLGALAGGVWLGSRDPRLLVVCGVLLTAAAWTKVEGLWGALLVVVMLAVATRLRPWRVLLPLLLAPIVFIVPWRVWTRDHHIVSSGAVPYANLAHPSLLWAARGRLWTALADTPGYLVDPGAWLLAVPVAVLLAVLIFRVRADLAVYTWGLVVLAFLGNVAVYWVSAAPIQNYIETSAPRVVSSNAVTCALLLPLLFSVAAAPSPEAQPATPGERRRQAAPAR